MARVYREMRRDELDAAKGTRLVNALESIRRGLEQSNIENRVAEIAKRIAEIEAAPRPGLRVIK
jgi:hypothetical protein